MSKQVIKKQERLIIDTKDYRGIRVVFTEKKWKQKSKQHVWLLNNRFLSYIKKAIQDPTEVWQDYDQPRNRHCYYYRYGINLYAKVVVWIGKGRAHVVTAYDYTGLYFVKESRYPNLRRIYEK